VSHRVSLAAFLTLLRHGRWVDVRTDGHPHCCAVDSTATVATGGAADRCVAAPAGDKAAPAEAHPTAVAAHVDRAAEDGAGELSSLTTIRFLRHQKPLFSLVGRESVSLPALYVVGSIASR
jgi:hypothetical protein